MSAAFEIEAKMVAANLPSEALDALDMIDLDPEEAVAEDLAALRAGDQTTASLLAYLIDGAGDDEVVADGWRAYVATLEAHLAREVKS